MRSSFRPAGRRPLLHDRCETQAGHIKEVALPLDAWMEKMTAHRDQVVRTDSRRAYGAAITTIVGLLKMVPMFGPV